MEATDMVKGQRYWIDFPTDNYELDNGYTGYGIYTGNTEMDGPEECYEFDIEFGAGKVGQALFPFSAIWLNKV